MNSHMHKVTFAILWTLRHRQRARFSELMQPTGLQSDSFKFYLRDLVQQGYVTKTATGDYELTASGKEYANRLGDDERAPYRQPKLSVLLIVVEPSKDTTPRYLFQQRQRNPYLGFWGTISGPVLWGETLEAAADRELRKQTGLAARFVVRTFVRQRDRASDSGELFEDKLFAVMCAVDVQGKLSNTWHGGSNRWMTLEQLEGQPKYFALTRQFIEYAETSVLYTQEDVAYDIVQY